MSVAFELPGAPAAPVRGRYSAFVRPAPPLEPPYDPLDGDTSLAVVSPLAEPLPFEEAAPRQTKLGNDFWGPQPTARRNLRDPRPIARQFLQATLEMLHGRRSPQQLQAWTSPAVFNDLVRARTSAPSTRSTPPAVQSVHVSEPVDGVAEVCAVIRRGERRRAMAARLEGIDGQWRCVKLQIG
jgi:hypothetical protein